MPWTDAGATAAAYALSAEQRLDRNLRIFRKPRQRNSSQGTKEDIFKNMEFRADLKCMVCSHFLGEVSGLKLGPAKVSVRGFVPGPHFSGSRRPAPTRCDKCGGHLYLDEVELLRPAGMPATIAA